MARIIPDGWRELDDKAVRKLFVGATRSMMRLTLIVGGRATVADWIAANCHRRIL